MDAAHKAELKQILDVLEGDEIRLDDLISAFMVYKVLENPEAMEVVLRDHGDGEEDSIARHRVKQLYQEVKMLGAGVGADDTSGAPVIGENILVLTQRAQGKDLISAKVLDVVASEGQRATYQVQLADGSESSLARSMIYTLKEASVPHHDVTPMDILPETKELEPPSAAELHALGLQPDKFAEHLNFASRHQFREILFCRNFAPFMVRTETLTLTPDDIEAFLSHNMDHLQETVAPQVASMVSLFITASYGGGSEVSGGSNRRSDGGKSGVSGTHREDSEVGSQVSGANRSQAPAKSQVRCVLFLTPSDVRISAYANAPPSTYRLPPAFELFRATFS